MSTGIETWNQNLLDIGPMYPFPGTEVLWVVIGLVTWVLWHVYQARVEKKVLEHDDKLFEGKEKLRAGMELANAETLLEAIKVEGDKFRKL